MSQPSDLPSPAATMGDQASDGVFDAVRDGYDAVYSALPGSDTFSQLWRANAYRGEFPAEFAHIGFLTVGEAHRLLALLTPGAGDVVLDVACGTGGPGLWVARQAGASLIGVDPSPAGLADPVADYRPLLEAAGFEVLAYEETPGWAERVEAAFSAIVNAADILAAEMGEQAAASAVAEARITLELRPYPRRVLVAAALP